MDQYVYFGGYPGAAALIEDRQRWARYMVESLIETTLSRDILLMTRVDEPALLRRLFLLGCDYSGQILSYQKILSQLQDAGTLDPGALPGTARRRRDAERGPQVLGEEGIALGMS